MKNYILKTYLALSGLILALPLFAFPGDPDGSDDPLPEPMPIDNWIFVLVFAALAVGIYFVAKAKRKSLI